MSLQVIRSHPDNRRALRRCEGLAVSLGLVRHGFAYASSYTLTLGQPSPGLGYLSASPHRLTTVSLGRALPRRAPKSLADSGA
jgi:hypothetical protein